jgi:glycosyltransferase involved in cell wall biosynthesis
VSAEEPLISVIMAAHNHEDYVAEAVESILGQTYPNVELVAIDDGSEDGTGSILEDYAQRNPDRVRVRRRAQARGPCRRRNEALGMVRGELICWLDSDDVWHPEKVAKQVALMGSRPEVGLVYSRYETFDSTSGESASRTESGPVRGDQLRALAERGDFIGALTIMFRRRIVDDQGGELKNPDWIYGDGYLLCLLAALDSEVVGSDEVLARHRVHGANASLMNRNYPALQLGILERFLRDRPGAAERLGRSADRALARHQLRSAAWERERGSGAAAVGYTRQASRLAPLLALRRRVRAGLRPTARNVALGLAGILALPGIVGSALVARAGTARRRRSGQLPRLIWGPVPLISLKYWSLAMRERGYESTTVVHGFYGINVQGDFDRYFDEFLGTSRFWLLWRDYWIFCWTLLHGDVHLTFFDGGFLRATPLRRLEGPLLRLAGKKLVVSPYGSDTAVPGFLGVTEEALLLDYPQFRPAGPGIKRRVDYFARWANLIVRNYQNGYIPRGDVLWVTQLAIDIPKNAAKGAGVTGNDDEVVVVHAPNHRHVKGTAALIDAVEALTDEGLNVRLDVIERRKNDEVRKAIASADILADQFIAGYAMFAIEGLAVGKPVLSALSGMPPEARAAASLGECPIVDANEQSVEGELRRLVQDSALRRELGDAGRSFASRYHSLDAVASSWEIALGHLWRGEPLPAELPIPRPGESAVATHRTSPASRAAERGTVTR